MKEQSAVDFLHSKILFNIGLDDNDIFKLRELVKIAKKMEKQQGERYYNETYGDKRSDVSSFQTEISEKEILTEADYRYVIEDEIEAFMQGANWMQEQLNINKP